jgi:hypothetical protein
MFWKFSLWAYIISLGFFWGYKWTNPLQIKPNTPRSWGEAHSTPQQSLTAKLNHFE